MIVRVQDLSPTLSPTPSPTLSPTLSPTPAPTVDPRRQDFVFTYCCAASARETYSLGYDSNDPGSTGFPTRPSAGTVRDEYLSGSFSGTILSAVSYGNDGTDVSAGFRDTFTYTTTAMAGLVQYGEIVIEYECGCSSST